MFLDPHRWPHCVLRHLQWWGAFHGAGGLPVWYLQTDEKREWVSAFTQCRHTSLINENHLTDRFVSFQWFNVSCCLYFFWSFFNVAELRNLFFFFYHCVKITDAMSFVRSQKRLGCLPPPHQRAVAPLPVLQAAFDEIPQAGREGRQRDERGARPLQQQRPPVRLCHRGAAKLPHLPGLAAPCAGCVCSLLFLAGFGWQSVPIDDLWHALAVFALYTFIFWMCIKMISLELFFLCLDVCDDFCLLATCVTVSLLSPFVSLAAQTLSVSICDASTRCWNMWRDEKENPVIFTISKCVIPFLDKLAHQNSFDHKWDSTFHIEKLQYTSTLIRHIQKQNILFNILRLSYIFFKTSFLLVWRVMSVHSNEDLGWICGILPNLKV